MSPPSPISTLPMELLEQIFRQVYIQCPLENFIGEPATTYFDKAASILVWTKAANYRPSWKTFDLFNAAETCQLWRDIIAAMIFESSCGGTWYVSRYMRLKGLPNFGVFLDKERGEHVEWPDEQIVRDQLGWVEEFVEMQRERGRGKRLENGGVSEIQSVVDERRRKNRWRRCGLSAIVQWYRMLFCV